MIIDKVITIASVIVFNSDNKILLLKRSEKSSFPHHWQLPEGKMEISETPEVAVRREVLEELGINLPAISFTSVTYSELDAKGQHYLAIRICFTTQLNTGDVTLSDEHEAFDWYSKEESLKLLLLPGVEKALQTI